MKICPLLLSAALTISLGCNPASANDDTLTVDQMEACTDASGDTLSMAECLDQQIVKADRWRTAVVTSYRRMAEEDLAELSHGGKPPYDTLGLLSESEVAFDEYRKKATDLVQGTGLIGSGNKLFVLQAKYRMTIDHIRFLLDECYAPERRRLGETIDLTKTDWCALGGAK
jgi:uncharacterized protein YecT (DUF1311 family)